MVPLLLLYLILGLLVELMAIVTIVTDSLAIMSIGCRTVLFSVLFLEIDESRFPHQHYRYHKQTSNNQELLECPLVAPKYRCGILAISPIISKLCIYCDHSGNDGRGLAWTLALVWMQPLIHNQEVHIEKCWQHKHSLGNGKQKQLCVVFSPDVVQKTYTQAQQHMNHPDNYRDFHLEAIGELHLVLGHFPHRVNPNGINTIIVPLYRMALPLIATVEKTKIKTKELVVNDATVSHPKYYGPGPYICLRINQQWDSHKHMPHISEHHANKKAECNYVRYGWVVLPVARDPVGVEDLLRDSQNLR